MYFKNCLFLFLKLITLNLILEFVLTIKYWFSLTVKCFHLVQTIYLQMHHVVQIFTCSFHFLINLVHRFSSKFLILNQLIEVNFNLALLLKIQFIICFGFGFAIKITLKLISFYYLFLIQSLASLPKSKMILTSPLFLYFQIGTLEVEWSTILLYSLKVDIYSRKTIVTQLSVCISSKFIRILKASG